MTSTCGSRDFIRSIPEDDFMSTAILLFLLARTSGVGAGGLLLWDVGETRSRRRTDAP